MDKEGMAINRAPAGFIVDITRKDRTEIIFDDEIAKNNFAPIVDEDYFYVIDETVARLYSIRLTDIFLTNRWCLVPGGDTNKNNENLNRILNALYDKKISRQGTIVAIGGGVVTDLSGLAANLYFRGIRIIHIPTTLLAMVDAAIGGKVGINHPHQKNLLGAFYQPSKIIISKEFLATLPKSELESAMGEVLKIAIISSPPLFELLNEFNYDNDLQTEKMNFIIRTCIENKISILGTNCYERTFDRALNFGHSVGHPIEDITNFRVKHGAAVAMGIAAAATIAKNRGICSEETLRRIISTMQSLHLTVFDETINTDKLWQHVQRLVLQRGGKELLYVIPVRIGEVIIIPNISEKEFYDAVKSLENTLPKAFI